ncbi:crossover junction endonuclease EME1B-like isoform X2 [Argentina anserina]|uniref:crossover junction endonuclease EME1B-like isoform X2 n=1 Tax=Argentina anserina TaxID=57926 RepID=UPI0021767FE8|nr:crossover junction endonuclease EME1B-like isoform X2 [Potentilla anserina]
MSEPIILSDEEEDNPNAPSSPFPPFPSKKRKTQFDPDPNPTVLILDDDPTLLKPGPKSTAYFVPDTPDSDVAIVKCTRASQPKFSGIDGLICLESDNEPGSSCGGEKRKENGLVPGGFGLAKVLDWSPSFVESSSAFDSELGHTFEGSSSNPTSFLQGDIDQVLDCLDDENIMNQMGNIMGPGKESIAIVEKENVTKEIKGRKKMTKEERTRLMEEKKQKRLEEKLQREALKAEAAEMKKLQKEKQRWEKGKFALKSIVAEIDSKVIESGSVGGSLLTRFAERGLTYRITSNPIERSIVWTMTIPEHISQLSPGGVEIQYILIVYEAEDFCKLIISESLREHVSRVQNHYPSYTVCYLTNKLIAYVRKREGELYNGRGREGHPTVDKVEKVLANLTTSFSKVHSRQCKDEAELSEHVVGLTCSLSSCLFRKKLTRLDVNANGSFITKDCVDRHLIKKSSWLKALVAIPKVQPRFAIAIGKKYPTMKSLLSVYMDPNMSVHEKEFLLKDLMTEGLVGGDRRLGEVCSKRVYRILMAQNGCTKTDDVEDGADFFRVN